MSTHEGMTPISYLASRYSIAPQTPERPNAFRDIMTPLQPLSITQYWMPDHLCKVGGRLRT